MGLLAIFKKPQPTTDLSTQVIQGGGSTGGLVTRSVADQYAIRSMVHAGMVINGDVTSECGAAVDGTVNGSVTVNGGNSALLVREGAIIRGHVRAPLALVRGFVQGDIDARFVRLFPGARVAGRIRAARLIVDDGAHILNDEVAVGEREDNRTPPEPRGPVPVPAAVGNSGVLHFHPADAFRREMR